MLRDGVKNNCLAALRHLLGSILDKRSSVRTVICRLFLRFSLKERMNGLELKNVIILNMQKGLLIHAYSQSTT
jgi:hypothetical protein